MRTNNDPQGRRLQPVWGIFFFFVQLFIFYNQELWWNIHTCPPVSFSLDKSTHTKAHYYSDVSFPMFFFLCQKHISIPD